MEDRSPPAEVPLCSPLDARHRRAHARMTGFGGWEMPLQYAGVVSEVAVVRSAAGLFDVSHLGKIAVTGPGARDFLDRCLTNDLGRVAAGRAQYTLCCDEVSGGIVDDLLVYVVSGDSVLLVPNAANAAEVLRRLREEAPPLVSVADRHRDLALLAVQGPSSDGVLEAADLPHGHSYLSFVETHWHASQVTVCRTGYTGERGYELLVDAGAAGRLWDALLEAGQGFGLRPCGLAARDVLRLEMGYPLHGQDLSPTVTAVMARLEWAVGWRKPRFWGREVLLAQREAPPDRALTGINARGPGVPRRGMPVLSADGRRRVLGEITSGTWSPTLGHGIGLALLDRSAQPGDEVLIDVRGRDLAGVVRRPPFVSASPKSGSPSA